MHVSKTHSSSAWVIVNTKHMLCNIEVSEIFCVTRRDIIVEMSSVAMLAKAVKVIHSQIQALHTAQYTVNA